MGGGKYREDRVEASSQTLNRTDELRPAVELSRNAGKARVKSVASLNEALASRDLGPQRQTLGTLRIVVHSVRSITGPVRDGSHLLVRIRDSVCEDD